jgi:hypothetical protein
MLPIKYLFFVQSLLVSGFMSFMVSGVITYLNLGITHNFVGIWIHAWLIAYVIAYPAILIVFPFAQKLSLKICSKN